MDEEHDGPGVGRWNRGAKGKDEGRNGGRRGRDGHTIMNGQLILRQAGVLAPLSEQENYEEMTMRIEPLERYLVVGQVAAMSKMSAQGEGRRRKGERGEGKSKKGRTRTRKTLEEKLKHLIVVLYSGVSLYTCQNLQASWLSL